MIRKTTLVVGFTALGICLASPAFAGERKGNGGWTPIGTYQVVAAICAFSGLEDHQHGTDPAGPVVPGETQTPHSEGGVVLPPGVASVCKILNPGKLFKS